MAVCLPPLPEVAVIEEEWKRKRDADGETLAERSRHMKGKCALGTFPVVLVIKIFNRLLRTNTTLMSMSTSV
jgi:hypothetical protein